MGSSSAQSPSTAIIREFQTVLPFLFYTQQGTYSRNMYNALIQPSPRHLETWNLIMDLPYSRWPQANSGALMWAGFHTCDLRCQVNQTPRNSPALKFYELCFFLDKQNYETFSHNDSFWLLVSFFLILLISSSWSSFPYDDTFLVFQVVCISVSIFFGNYSYNPTSFSIGV